jgi:hypothetical protein
MNTYTQVKCNIYRLTETRIDDKGQTQPVVREDVKRGHNVAINRTRHRHGLVDCKSVGK